MSKFVVVYTLFFEYSNGRPTSTAVELLLRTVVENEEQRRERVTYENKHEAREYAFLFQKFFARDFCVACSHFSSK